MRGESLNGFPTFIDNYERQNTIWFKAGENISYLNQAVKGDENSIVSISLAWSSTGKYKEFSGFQIMLDGQYYTLKEAVNKHKIKPIVIMNSGNSSSIYSLNNPTNLYDGGEIAGYYSCLYVYFMLEKDVSFIRYKINSKFELVRRAGSESITKINNKIMHLK